MFGKIEDEVILKYDNQVPRYTSYPTAPHFSAKINGEIYADWLKNLPEEETISLYFHIPFCKQLCWYCGCYTKATQRYAPVEDYVHILLREIRIVSEKLKGKNCKVSHIHFGGGSPTILLPESFDLLMQTIKSEFEITNDAEIAIEVDPRNVNEEKVASYAKSGINRVSIGVQDFNQEVQVAINREQSFDVVYDCIKLFRKYNIENINLDLIYGLPKQTTQMVKKNIDFAMLLKPSRIALFAYAHVQWKKKHMRLIDENDLPDSLERLEMYREAAQKLEKEGYSSIGLDHFAKSEDNMVLAFKDEKLKRNFQGYSTDNANVLIGFGVSSISYLPFGYAQNTLDFAEYKKSILAGILPVAKGIAISQEDIIRKRIIDELMCYLEVDLNVICDSFNLPKNYFEKEITNLQNLKKDGLVRTKNNLVKINLTTPQICRVVSSIFDKFFEPSEVRHSKMA
jgi:oxygen-independent coproporphyrinogen III oxidase